MTIQTRPDERMFPASLTECAQAVEDHLCRDSWDDHGDRVRGRHGFLWEGGKDFCNGAPQTLASAVALREALERVLALGPIWQAEGQTQPALDLLAVLDSVTPETLRARATDTDHA